MSISRSQLGDLYYSKGGLLERKFLGCILHLSLHIKMGWYANPNANQLAWADYCWGCTMDEKSRIAREAMEWGLGNNDNLQNQGDALPDGDLDFITAEYTKTWTQG
jgi:hypothetical protein